MFNMLDVVVSFHANFDLVYGAAALVTAYLGSGQIGRRKKIFCESSQISFAIQVEHF